jgi:protein-S-isoprenylcysteine O-methyltransferase Ste14
MRSTWAAAAGSTVFFLVAPAFIAGLVPRWMTHWKMSAPLLGWTGFRYVGAALVLAGTAVLVDAFARFVRHGGTPAPPLPTEKLVVTGLYRYVRNPMYLGVLSAILGQSLLFGASGLFAYAAFVAVAFHLFVLAYEEPTLRGRYGAEYDRYCRAVRRWWPRSSPWLDAGR